MSMCAKENEIKDVVIKYTHDYYRFNFIGGNRDINTCNLYKLTEELKKENLLHLHPIIVNKDFEIIDGQHRFLAAKELGIGFYYILDENVSIDHVVNGNSNQCTFEVKDYIKYYAVEKNNPHYILLRKMLVNTGLNPKALIGLIRGFNDGINMGYLRDGKFEFTESEKETSMIDFYKRFTDFCKKQKVKPLKMFNSYNFTIALHWIKNTRNFDSKQFFKKIEEQWYLLKPQLGSKNWYKLLLNIYNHRQIINRIEASMDLD